MLRLSTILPSQERCVVVADVGPAVAPHIDVMRRVLTTIVQKKVRQQRIKPSTHSMLMQALYRQYHEMQIVLFGSAGMPVKITR